MGRLNGPPRCALRVVDQVRHEDLLPDRYGSGVADGTARLDRWESPNVVSGRTTG